MESAAGQPRGDEIDRALRRIYEDVVQEPVPNRLRFLLRHGGNDTRH